jgi:hypothetical protein
MPLLGTRAAGSIKGFGLTSGQARKPYSASYLVIAGGGGGGGGSPNSTNGGGGGAGGYRNSYASETSGGGGSTETPLTFNPDTVYTITIGNGGAGNIGGPGGTTSGGSAGSTSSLAGPDISTVSSVV